MSGPLFLRKEKTLPRIGGIVLPKITFWRAIAFVILVTGLYSLYVRFFEGLGASTALTDATPWGLWVGFDVLCGVGLAAGGFTMAAAVYIFGLKKMHSIARPSILTAYLGYTLVSVGLIIDLGKPWNIWHPLVMWNHHSVMFEVAWCVMLYSTVLTLEFSPVLFEKLGWERPLKLVKKLTIPLVTAGVLLSIMHQSSLGSVFLIMPSKVHPLWYSSGLPIFFFVSAVACGLSMVIFESYLSARVLGHRLKSDVLEKLGRASVAVLGVLLVMRVFDLVFRGVAGELFAGTKEGWMCLAEIGLGIALPLGLYLSDRVRHSRKGLFVTATIVVLGFVMNRLNVATTAFERSTGTTYFPSFNEISITLFLVTVGIIAFGMAAKYLPVFPHHGSRH